MKCRTIQSSIKYLNISNNIASIKTEWKYPATELTIDSGSTNTAHKAEIKIIEDHKVTLQLMEYVKAKQRGEEVEKLVAPIAESFGCELVEVEFAKKHNGDNLTVFIDKKDGYIDIVDCETVHTAIDEPLDELDPTQGKPYTLNVSSPGIDRPIVTDKDFARNIGIDASPPCHSDGNPPHVPT